MIRTYYWNYQPIIIIQIKGPLPEIMILIGTFMMEVSNGRWGYPPIIPPIRSTTELSSGIVIVDNSNYFIEFIIIIITFESLVGAKTIFLLLLFICCI